MESKLVSICSITFNHDKYISQMIESVLLQKTNFKYVLLIGEDCSTDKTREICISYKEKYPDKIELILNKKNLGASNNFVNVLDNCQGKYIAICEGDDYWIDPYKLQKQVDFLEANPEYGLIYSDVEIVNYLGKALSKEKQSLLKTKDIFEGDIFYKLMKYGNCINTLTVCFRRELLSDWLMESYKRKYLYIQDYFIWLLIVSKSKVKLVNEITGAYRIHSASLTRDPNTIVGRKTWRYSETLGIEYYVKHNKNRIETEDFIFMQKKLIMQLIDKREFYLKYVTLKIIVNYSLKFVYNKLVKRGT